MTTFTQQETALFLSNGDFWLAVSNGATEELDGILAGLIEIADHTSPENLYGTMPDETVVCIGTSPRRPRKP